MFGQCEIAIWAMAAFVLSLYIGCTLVIYLFHSVRLWCVCRDFFIHLLMFIRSFFRVLNLYFVLFVHFVFISLCILLVSLLLYVFSSVIPWCLSRFFSFFSCCLCFSLRLHLLLSRLLNPQPKAKNRRPTQRTENTRTHTHTHTRCHWLRESST